MDLLYNKRLNYGYTEIIGEEIQELNYVTLGILRLKEGESFSKETGNYEIALVILGGSCSIETDNQTWSNLGKRLNVFQGKATSVYIPCNSSYKVTAESEVEIAVCGARAEKKTLPQLITPDDVVVNHLGKLNWRRDVHDIISLDNTDAHRIIIGETFNRPGCWSSYPPHRHDYNNLPEEVDLEEVYHFRVLPKQGFGIQRIYKEDQSLNEAYAVTITDLTSENNLTVQGEIEKDKETKKENYYCCERAYGTYSRTISLPAEVDQDKIKANFKNGILEITIPKKAEKKPKEITIEPE